ncbi:MULTISPECIES: hypothetical protein [Haloarcula]|uniref:hypothetical protein n=1 Tax=Haloarcula TaxID=2237 RepID=UPI0023E8B61F|nr:hypothetical protein [Halomicroarcula sp. SHR3]
MPELSVEDVAEILRHPERQELVVQLANREEIPIDDCGPSAYHNHIPKLVEYGVAERCGGMIHSTEKTEMVYECYEELNVVTPP